MLALLKKKKLTDNQVANIFVNGIIETAENAFPELAGFINDSPEFVLPPAINEHDYGRFLMIISAANLSQVSKHFTNGHDKAIIKNCIDKFAQVFELKPEDFARKIKHYKTFMARVNHPSKNPVYAMSKAMFFKYKLNAHQEEYFRELNTPNPIFLKNLDEWMRNFMWDWTTFTDKYKIV